MKGIERSYDQPPVQLLVVIASPRAERIGEMVGQWVIDQLPAHVEVAVVDLAATELPPDSALRPGGGQPTAATDLVAAADAFVVVTPEYNHSYPASLKRFIDWHLTEWQFKAATVVTYGVQGGLLAGEYLRPVFADLSVVTTRRMVSLRAPWNHLTERGLAPADGEAQAVQEAVRELCWWAELLREARTLHPLPADGSGVGPRLSAWLATQPHHVSASQLADAVDGADVIGLGFSTREAAEPLGLVADTTRILVEKGAAALALLENPRAVAEYNRFVAGDEIQLDHALAQGWGPGRTRELRDMLLWLRGWNAAHPAAPVQVAGVGQEGAIPADYDRVIELVGSVDHDRTQQVAEPLTVIRVAHDAGEHVLRARGLHPGQPFVELARQAQAVVEALPASSERDQALEAMKLIVDHHADAIGAGYDAGREERQAASAVLDLRQRLGRPVVVWEGSAHLAANTSMMGQHLRETLGSRYTVVHLTFGSGRTGRHLVAAPQAGSLEQLFAAARRPRIVDLRSQLPDDGAGLLERPIRTRLISGVYSADQDEDSYLELPSLRGSFDIVVFIPEITPAVPLRTTARQSGTELGA